MPSIGFFMPETTTGHTQGKFLFHARSLQRAGLDVTVLCWTNGVEEGCRHLGLPCYRVRVQQVQVNRVEEARKAHALLNRKLEEKEGAPTWGDLLAYDDIVGMATGFKLDGMGGFQPDILVGPTNGMEEATLDDEQMRLAIWRWARLNNIPQLGIELQTLDIPNRICTYPVDLLLTMKERKASHLAPVVFPLPPAYRYCNSFRNEPVIERFLEQEEQQRKQLAWEPGKYYLLFPFHIYYIDKCVKMLQELAPYAPQMQEAGIQLLFTCGKSTYRRGLYEQDIITQGLARWVAPFGQFQVVAGGNLLDWVWLCEGILLPYPHSMAESFRGMGIRVIQPEQVKEVKDLTLYVRPQEAVAWLLNQRRGDAKEAA